MKLKMGMIAVVVMGSFLTGCVTYSDIQKRALTYSGHTDKSPQAYAECVQPKWMEFSASAHIVPQGENRTIVFPTPGGSEYVTMTLSVDKSPSGSDVSMRTQPSLGSFEKQWKAAQSCL